jgi:hypothetical protein
VQTDIQAHDWRVRWLWHGRHFHADPTWSHVMPVLEQVRRSGYRITTADGGLIMITVPGKPRHMRLRVRQNGLWVGGPDEAEDPLLSDRVLSLVNERLGPAIEPWGRVVFL